VSTWGVTDSEAPDSRGSPQTEFINRGHCVTDDFAPDTSPMSLTKPWSVILDIHIPNRKPECLRNHVPMRVCTSPSVKPPITPSH